MDVFQVALVNLRCSSFSNSLNTFLYDETSGDLIFICEGNVLVKCHKPVLAAVSEFMCLLLKENLDNTTYISLPHVNSVTLKLLITLLYESECKIFSYATFQDIENLISLLKINLPNSTVQPAEPSHFVDVNIQPTEFPQNALIKQEFPVVEEIGYWPTEDPLDIQDLSSDAAFSAEFNEIGISNHENKNKLMSVGLPDETDKNKEHVCSSLPQFSNYGYSHVQYQEIKVEKVTDNEGDVEWISHTETETIERTIDKDANNSEAYNGPIIVSTYSMFEDHSYFSRHVEITKYGKNHQEKQTSENLSEYDYSSSETESADEYTTSEFNESVQEPYADVKEERFSPRHDELEEINDVSTVNGTDDGVFTKGQVDALLALYSHRKTPTKKFLARIAKAFKVLVSDVSHWFKMKRLQEGEDPHLINSSSANQDMKVVPEEKLSGRGRKRKRRGRKSYSSVKKSNGTSAANHSSTDTFESFLQEKGNHLFRTSSLDSILVPRRGRPPKRGRNLRGSPRSVMTRSNPRNETHSSSYERSKTFIESDEDTNLSKASSSKLDLVDSRKMSLRHSSRHKSLENNVNDMNSNDKSKDNEIFDNKSSSLETSQQTSKEVQDNTRHLRSSSRLKRFDNNTESPVNESSESIPSQLLPNNESSADKRRSLSSGNIKTIKDTDSSKESTNSYMVQQHSKDILRCSNDAENNKVLQSSDANLRLVVSPSRGPSHPFSKLNNVTGSLRMSSQISEMVLRHGKKMMKISLTQNVTNGVGNKKLKSTVTTSDKDQQDKMLALPAVSEGTIVPSKGAKVFNKGRRPITDIQKQKLEEAYLQTANFKDKDVHEKLAKELKLSVTYIRNWFLIKNCRDKKIVKSGEGKGMKKSNIQHKTFKRKIGAKNNTDWSSRTGLGYLHTKTYKGRYLSRKPMQQQTSPRLKRALRSSVNHEKSDDASVQESQDNAHQSSENVSYLLPSTSTNLSDPSNISKSSQNVSKEITPIQPKNKKPYSRRSELQSLFEDNIPSLAGSSVSSLSIKHMFSTSESGESSFTSSVPSTSEGNVPLSIKTMPLFPKRNTSSSVNSLTFTSGSSIPLLSKDSVSPLVKRNIPLSVKVKPSPSQSSNLSLTDSVPSTSASVVAAPKNEDSPISSKNAKSFSSKKDKVFSNPANISSIEQKLSVAFMKQKLRQKNNQTEENSILQEEFDSEDTKLSDIISSMDNTTVSSTSDMGSSLSVRSKQPVSITKRVITRQYFCRKKVKQDEDTGENDKNAALETIKQRCFKFSTFNKGNDSQDISDELTKKLSNAMSSPGNTEDILNWRTKISSTSSSILSNVPISAKNCFAPSEANAGLAKRIQAIQMKLNNEIKCEEDDEKNDLDAKPSSSSTSTPEKKLQEPSHTSTSGLAKRMQDVKKDPSSETESDEELKKDDQSIEMKDCTPVSEEESNELPESGSLRKIKPVVAKPVTCGVCGAVRNYRYINQARKFGTFACEPCRKFIIKMIKQTKVNDSSDLSSTLECHSGTGTCVVPSVVRRFNYKSRCPACWLKLCLSTFTIPNDMYENLLILLPPDMRNITKQEYKKQGRKRGRKRKANKASKEINLPLEEPLTPDIQEETEKTEMYGNKSLNRKYLESHIKSSKISQEESLKNLDTVNDKQSSEPQRITCAICRAVRIYKFVAQTKKYGVFACEPCRKFTSDMIRRAKYYNTSSSSSRLKCDSGRGTCVIHPVDKNNPSKTRCPACLLKLCLVVYQMPVDVYRSLLRLLPSDMINILRSQNRNKTSDGTSLSQGTSEEISDRHETSTEIVGKNNEKNVMSIDETSLNNNNAELCEKKHKEYVKESSHFKVIKMKDLRSNELVRKAMESLTVKKSPENLLSQDKPFAHRLKSPRMCQGKSPLPQMSTVQDKTMPSISSSLKQDTSRGGKHKRRLKFNDLQRRVLEKAYSKNKSPNDETKEELAKKLGMPVSSIHCWFTNRIAKYERGYKGYKVEFNEALENALETLYKENKLEDEDEQRKLSEKLRMPRVYLVQWLRNRQRKDETISNKEEQQIIPEQDKSSPAVKKRKVSFDIPELSSGIPNDIACDITSENVPEETQETSTMSFTESDTTVDPCEASCATKNLKQTSTRHSNSTKETPETISSSFENESDDDVIFVREERLTTPAIKSNEKIIYMAGTPAEYIAENNLAQSSNAKEISDMQRINQKEQVIIGILCPVIPSTIPGGNPVVLPGSNIILHNSSLKYVPILPSPAVNDSILSTKEDGTKSDTKASPQKMPAEVSNQPASSTSVTHEIVSSDSVAHQPVSSSSVAHQPVSSSSVAHQPVSSSSVAVQPVSSNSVTHQSVSSSSVSHQPVSSNSVILLDFGNGVKRSSSTNMQTVETIQQTSSTDTPTVVPIQPKESRPNVNCQSLLSCVQQEILEGAFNDNKHLDKGFQSQLANDLGLPLAYVKRWFRAKTTLRDSIQNLLKKMSVTEIKMLEDGYKNKKFGDTNFRIELCVKLGVTQSFLSKWLIMRCGQDDVGYIPQPKKLLSDSQVIQEKSPNKTCQVNKPEQKKSTSVSQQDNHSVQKNPDSNKEKGNIQGNSSNISQQRNKLEQKNPTMNKEQRYIQESSVNISQQVGQTVQKQSMANIQQINQQGHLMTFVPKAAKSAQKLNVVSYSLTKKQQDILECAYLSDKYDNESLKLLSVSLNVPLLIVKNWFQNRCSKDSKDKQADVTRTKK